MRVPRVYLDAVLPIGAPFELDERSSHYLCTVLRMAPGRELIAFDGRGNEYPAVLDVAHKKHAVIRARSCEAPGRESPLGTHLAVGISRGERFDFVLQKATELGVTRITPVFSERTEVRLGADRLAKKQEQWRQIVISACEQSQRTHLPDLLPATDLDGFLNQSQEGLKLILHHRGSVAIQQYPPPKDVVLLIGPEGGLADEEIECALAAGFAPVTLGPRVLRTETAPIVALTAAQLLWGDL